jgi:hypothetical protein
MSPDVVRHSSSLRQEREAQVRDGQQTSVARSVGFPPFVRQIAGRRIERHHLFGAWSKEALLRKEERLWDCRGTVSAGLAGLNQQSVGGRR